MWRFHNCFSSHYTFLKTSENTTKQYRIVKLLNWNWNFRMIVLFCWFIFIQLACSFRKSIFYYATLRWGSLSKRPISWRPFVLCTAPFRETIPECPFVRSQTLLANEASQNSLIVKAISRSPVPITARNSAHPEWQHVSHFRPPFAFKMATLKDSIRRRGECK